MLWIIERTYSYAGHFKFVSERGISSTIWIIWILAYLHFLFLDWQWESSSLLQTCISTLESGAISYWINFTINDIRSLTVVRDTVESKCEKDAHPFRVFHGFVTLSVDYANVQEARYISNKSTFCLLVSKPLENLSPYGDSLPSSILSVEIEIQSNSDREKVRDIIAGIGIFTDGKKTSLQNLQEETDIEVPQKHIRVPGRKQSQKMSQAFTTSNECKMLSDHRSPLSAQHSTTQREFPRHCKSHLPKGVYVDNKDSTKKPTEEPEKVVLDQVPQNVSGDGTNIQKTNVKIRKFRTFCVMQKKNKKKAHNVLKEQF